MASLLSAAKQTAINNIFVNLHDTFSRDIVVYKNAKKSVSISNSQFNGIYGNAGKTTSIVNQEVSQTFQARIYYTDLKEEILSDSNAPASKIILPQGSVKIIVDLTATEYIREARRVEFDGKIFAIISEWTPICLFDNLYYEFYLSPIDS
jgi:hypothetical protein